MISLRNDQGSASVEFIGLSIILLIPAMYLLITLSQLQAAGYAAVAAADQAAKTVGLSDNPRHAESRAIDTVELTAADFHLSPQATSTVIECSNSECSEPGTQISVYVSIDVALPLIPTFLGNPTRIATMSAVGYHRIGEFE